MDVPFTVPSLQIDMSRPTRSRSGITWMEWNHEGTLLGVRNGEWYSVTPASVQQSHLSLLFRADNHPAALYLFAFPPAREDALDQRVHPYLLGIVMTSSAITLASWRPASPDADGHAKSTLAFITSHSPSIHLWTHQAAGQSCTQIVEAVPVPIGEYSGR